MPSILITEIKASVLRHRLFDRLGRRADIIAPHDLAPAIARRISWFAVAGLDDTREPGTGGWPVFTGGRYVKLCFSPVIETLESNRLSDAVYRLPLTETEYIAYVEQITGIRGRDAADFARLYRFDAVELFDACRELRRECPPAWRLLLSNEFALARRLWPALGEVPTNSQFRRPLIEGFRIFAELERASLVMRHLTRARAILDRPRFLEALASPLTLASRYDPVELIEVCRWIEYACLSSATLTELVLGRTDAEVAALPRGYALWAIARGEMIGSGSDFLDHPQVRAALITAFSRPPIEAAEAKDDKLNSDDTSQRKLVVERRKSLLRNDEIVRWYGMTSEVLPIVALDDVRTRYPTRRAGQTTAASRRAVIRESSRPVLARIGSALRRHADPVMQRRVEGASTGYLDGSRLAASRSASLEGNTKLGLKLALLYLPRPPRPGSAARFDPAVWVKPGRDAEFWRMLLDPRRGGELHRLRHPARRQLRTAIGIMRRVYAPLFAKLQWSFEVERVVCDMAVALSPISADPHIAFAIHTLGLKLPLAKRLGVTPRQGNFKKGR